MCGMGYANSHVLLSVFRFAPQSGIPAWNYYKWVQLNKVTVIAETGYVFSRKARNRQLVQVVFVYPRPAANTYFQDALESRLYVHTHTHTCVSCMQIFPSRYVIVRVHLITSQCVSLWEVRRWSIYRGRVDGNVGGHEIALIATAPDDAPVIFRSPAGRYCLGFARLLPVENGADRCFLADRRHH